MQNLSWNGRDKEYVAFCLTNPMKNPYNEQNVLLYAKENFNVDVFIEKNTKNICKICKKTMNKMLKNVMIFVEDMQMK